MIPAAIVMAVGAVALGLTALWAILARETQLYLTAGGSWAAWAFVALAAGDMALVQGGEPVYVRVPALQYLALAFAVVSLLVWMLHFFDAYPPDPSRSATKSQ